MGNVAIHHVVAQSVDPFSVVAVDGLECTASEVPGVISVEHSIVAVVLQIGHHEEPKAAHQPWNHADHGKVSSSQGMPQCTCRCQADQAGNGRTQFLLQWLSLPHSSIEVDVATIRDSKKKVDQVEEWQLKISEFVSHQEP